MRDLSRQTFLGENATEILESTTVGLFGLNGGGSHFAQQLANIGFKNFVLCDPQDLDESNLNRNVVGSVLAAREKRAKVDIAAERILMLVPDAKIVRIKEKWQEAAAKGLLDPCNAFLSSLDSMNERAQLETFARTRRVPLLDVGMDVKELSTGKFAIFGQAIMTVPNGPCMRCIGYLKDDELLREAALYGDAGVRPQVVWPNGTLASTTIGFLMGHLFNYSPLEPQYWYQVYDGNAFTLRNNEESEFLVKAMKGRCPHFDN